MAVGTAQGDDLTASNNEAVYGLFGNDVLRASTGNEYIRLVGGKGDDTYVMGYGLGVGIVEDGYSSNDTAFLLASDSEIYTWIVDGRHLVAADSYDGATLYVADWENPANRIENWNINGSTYSYEGFRNLVYNNPNHQGDVTGEALFGAQEANYLRGLLEEAYQNGAAYELQNVQQRFAGLDDVVYRFYNQESGRHFYTASETERDAVVANNKQFLLEGTAFAVTSDADASDVFRFYNSETGAHFYTISEVERDFIIENLNNFNFEGTAYQAHTNEADGTEALYRFYNTENGTHFYTTSEAERDAVIENLPNFNYEGIAYYVDGLA